MAAWEWVVAFASPVLAFVGAYAGQRIAGRTDDRLDRWRRREETMRMLRWAVDKSLTQEDDRGMRAGAQILAALLDTELLQSEDVSFVAAVARVIADENPR